MERLQTNIDSQIACGVQLRKAKKRGSVLNKPLEVAGHGTLKRRFFGNYNLSQAEPCCSLKSSAPFTRTVSPNRAYSPAPKNNFSRPRTPTSVPKPKSVRGCSLRVAELAEPSKRHCIETWKSTRNTLPGFMLDRLRNTIMNKKIIAKIPDAFNSFQSKAKTTSSRRERNNICGKRSDYAKRREAEEIMYIRNMCAVFAHCMAKRLIKPLIVTMTPELDKLSHMVAEEMMTLLQKNRSELVPDFLQNPNILKEMSEKVAIWIARIMNDVYYKMLEEDLRAKKREENKLGKSGELLTSIETYNRKQLDRGDLEEEEGPALDALDQLIDTVVHRCVKISDSEDDDDNLSSQIESERAESSYGTDNSTIDIHDKESVDSKESYRRQVETKDLEPNNEVISKKIQSEPAIYNITKQNFDDPEAISSASVENDRNPRSVNEESVDMNGPETDVRSLLNSLLKEAQLNVSEVFVLPSEEPYNEKKAVTFTDVVLGSETKQSIESRMSNTDSPVVQRKSDIVLAPPNDHLLSFADELWPEDFFNPTLKAIAKVSKSVTSLGKIFETAENYDEAGVESFTIQHRHISNTAETEPNISKVTNNKIKILENNQCAVDNERKKHRLQNERDEPNIDTNLTAKVVDKGVSQFSRDFSIKYANLKMDDNDKQIEAKNPVSLRKLNVKHEDAKAKDTVSANGDHTNRDNDPISKGVKQKLNPSPRTCFDYNVSLQTAPSWVTQSISKESLNNSHLAKKHHICQCDLRKWCKDLEHILINLEQWNQWIDVMCRKIMLMKQEAKMKDKFSPFDKVEELRAWSKLKKSIDKDALQWRKLCQRTQIVLRNNNIKAITDKSKILPTDYSVACKCRANTMKRNTCPKVKKYIFKS